MGSVSVSSCRCMFVSCVHPVAVLNASFCMTCSLLMLGDDARGDHIEEQTTQQPIADKSPPNHSHTTVSQCTIA